MTGIERKRSNAGRVREDVSSRKVKQDGAAPGKMKTGSSIV